MSISDLYFIFILLPVVLIAYYLLPKGAVRQWLLILAGLFFYACGSPSFFLLFIAATIVNTVLGQLLVKKKFQFQKVLLVIGIVVNLSLLFFFKYTDFFLENIHKLNHTDYTAKNLLLPLGLSFYVFKAISFLVDCYKGVIEDSYSVTSGLTYLVFFGQLQSGPLSRVSDFSAASPSADKIALGLKRFILGFCKKLLLANVLAGIVDTAFSTAELSTAMAWLGSICFSLQLFYDFSGYSDMAIGLTNMFGYNCPENFNYPYMTKSISEFWRRWHITLGAWFRDYVYIPMGGSRVAKGRLILNLFVVWLLTGLWHGANWTFICWGLFYFVLIAFEKLTGLPGRIHYTAGRILYRILVLFLINLQWVLFRSSDIRQGFSFIRAMFIPAGGDSAAHAAFLLKDNLWCILLSMLFCIPVAPKLREILLKKLSGLSGKQNLFLIGQWIGITLLFAWAVSFLVAGANNPFVYANF